MKVKEKTDSVLRVVYRRKMLFFICGFFGILSVPFVFWMSGEVSVTCSRSSATGAGADGGDDHCHIVNHYLFRSSRRSIPISAIRGVRVATHGGGQGISVSAGESNTCRVEIVTTEGVRPLNTAYSSHCGTHFQMTQKLIGFLQSQEMGRVKVSMDTWAFVFVFLAMDLFAILFLFLFGGARITTFDKGHGIVTVHYKRFFRPMKEKVSISMNDFLEGKGPGKVPGRVNPGLAALDLVEGTGLINRFIGWYPGRKRHRRRVEAEAAGFFTDSSEAPGAS